MGKADFKRATGKSKYIQWTYRDRKWICVSTKWIRWAKRRMSRDTRRKQGRLVADYWCYMADGSVVCPQCGNRIDGLNWDVGPRCKACGSENIIVERMDRNDTARTHKTEY